MQFGTRTGLSAILIRLGATHLGDRQNVASSLRCCVRWGDFDPILKTKCDEDSSRQDVQISQCLRNPHV